MVYHAGMTDRPIVVPPGFQIEEDGDTLRVVKRPDDLLSHSLSVRLNAHGYARIRPFLQSFGHRRTSDALRWLLEHPDVQKVMDQRVAAATTRRKVG